MKNDLSLSSNASPGITRKAQRKTVVPNEIEPEKGKDKEKDKDKDKEDKTVEKEVKVNDTVDLLMPNVLLVLQGIITSEEYLLDESALLCAPFPKTIVDISTRRVLQVLFNAFIIYNFIFPSAAHSLSLSKSAMIMFWTIILRT